MASKIEIKQIQWFAESLAAGRPECICSLCGRTITDAVPVRMFEDGLEARFDHACSTLVTKRPELRPAYQYYYPDLGLPLNWQDEKGAKLAAAVMAYFMYMANKDEPPPTPEQLALTIEYGTHYIFAPCWDKSGFARELLQLRYEIQCVKTLEQLDRWIHKCLEITIDPF